MDLNKLLGSFTLSNIPRWTCPSCARGILRVIEDTLVQREGKTSDEGRREEWYDADHAALTYSCMLRCTNCGVGVSNIGSGKVREEHIAGPEGYESEYINHYEPLYFFPHLQLIDIPEDTPEAVKNILNDSFGLFFSSKHSAVNLLRSALEALLTDLGVTIKDNEALHCRIDRLTGYNNIKSLLIAAKWVGNAGSHCDPDMKDEDAISAFQFMELILKETYCDKKNEIYAKAQRINLKNKKKS